MSVYNILMTKRAIFIVSFILVFIAAGLLWYANLKLSSGDNTTNEKTTTSVRDSSEPELEHVVIIVEENKPYAAIIGNGNAPYINSVLKEGASAANYSAITNPSLPNYIALTSGTTAGITNDCSPSTNSGCEANVTNIADSIEKSARTWKMYAEDMPNACATENSGNYAVRHNPFVYYPNIRNDRKRCVDHVVPFTEFEKDIADSKLPNYAFISPNLCNDMHDCSVKVGDQWLSKQVPAILGSSSFSNSRSLLVITWDEGARWDNNVPTIFLGSAARKDYVSDHVYNHFSLLRTIENEWRLPTLTDNDKRAVPMNDMLK